MKLPNSSFSTRTADGITRISVFIKEDEELAKQIIKEIQKMYFRPCEKCGKFMIVNSPNHVTCWRCKK